MIGVDRMHQGDYNMTPDRHLGAAWIDKCKPDVIITESTYATTIRDSKRYVRFPPISGIVLGGTA